MKKINIINIEKVEKIIENIKKTEDFKKAITHVSYCNENGLQPNDSYENLEFLGDSILNFLTCQYLYRNFPEYNEGKMSKLKQLMVQEKTLAVISKEIELTKHILLGEGEKKNKGLCKDSILADVFESVIAALYLNKGHKQTANFLKLTLFSWIKGKETTIWDYKTQLQEYCQSQKNSVMYEIINNQKRNKKLIFVVVAKDRFNTFREEGRGSNKKEAEQKAAEKVLKKMGFIPIAIEENQLSD